MALRSELCCVAAPRPGIQIPLRLRRRPPLTRRSLPSPPCRPSAGAAPRPTRADLPPCLRTCALTTANECKHHLVLGDINSRDDEIILCHHPAPFLARFGLKGPCNCSG